MREFEFELGRSAKNPRNNIGSKGHDLIFIKNDPKIIWRANPRERERHVLFPIERETFEIWFG